MTDSLVLIIKTNRPLTEGYVALQAESQPVEFRRIELRDLVSYMTPKEKNYRPYSVKDAIGKCLY